MLSVAPPSCITLSTNGSQLLVVVKTALILTAGRFSAFFLCFWMNSFKGLYLAAFSATFFVIFGSGVQSSSRIPSLQYSQSSHLGCTLFGWPHGHGLSWGVGLALFDSLELSVIASKSGICASATFGLCKVFKFGNELNERRLTIVVNSFIPCVVEALI